MTSIAAAGAGYGPVNAYRLNGASVSPIGGAFRASADLTAQVRANDSAFQRQMKVSSDPNAVAPEITAANRSVQAHTVFRQGGQVVAAVWRDGQTLMGNGLAASLDWPSLQARTAGMSDAQRRDTIADAIAKQLGSSAQVRRYGESETAPTRGVILDTMNAANLAARDGR